MVQEYVSDDDDFNENENPDCKKKHESTDITFKESDGLVKKFLNDDYNRSRCNDCLKVYNRLTTEHCCCRCTYCHRKYSDIYDHKCTTIEPNFCKKTHGKVKLSSSNFKDNLIYFKCLDCSEIFNYNQDHCCCVCTKCNKTYGDPFDEHMCGNIKLDPIFCRKTDHSYDRIDSIKPDEDSDEDGVNEVKCKDCNEVYDIGYQDHCCCKCWECGNEYSDPYSPHDCNKLFQSI